MNIRHGDFRISSDAYQWMFQHYLGLDKQGRERWDTWGYYGKLEHLVSAVSERLLRRADGNFEAELVEVVKILQPLLRDLRKAQRDILGEAGDTLPVDEDFVVET